jgi:Mor family transcriptional regulator
LQKILEDIAAVIGLPQTLELVSRWGGRELYVPANMDRQHPIAFAIGLNAACDLSAAFAGVTLSIPIERNAVIDIRNRLIYEERQAGASKCRLSVRWGMTRQGIDSVLAKMAAAQQQESTA